MVIKSLTGAICTSPVVIIFNINMHSLTSTELNLLIILLHKIQNSFMCSGLALSISCRCIEIARSVPFNQRTNEKFFCVISREMVTRS